MDFSDRTRHAQLFSFPIHTVPLCLILGTDLVLFQMFDNPFYKFTYAGIRSVRSDKHFKKKWLSGLVWKAPSAKTNNCVWPGTQAKNAPKDRCPVTGREVCVCCSLKLAIDRQIPTHLHSQPHH